MPETVPTLPQWQSHKIVEADRITEVISIPMPGDLDRMHRWRLSGGAVVDVSDALYARVTPGVSATAGYYVRYPDGYESWSPAQAFDDGYTRLETEPLPGPAR